MYISKLVSRLLQSTFEGLSFQAMDLITCQWHHANIIMKANYIIYHKTQIERNKNAESTYRVTACLQQQQMLGYLFRFLYHFQLAV